MEDHLIDDLRKAATSYIRPGFQSAEAEPMNHPSIGGKEQEPQSSYAQLLEAVNYALGGMLSRWSLDRALSSVPPGWMKTEQGWVQMEELNLRLAGLSRVYRVKQPSKDHPVGL